MTHENLREDDTSLQSSPPCLISLSTSSISSFTAIAAKRGGSFRTGTIPSHLSTGKILAFPSRPVSLLQNRKPSSLPFYYQLDIPLPLSTGYHHNHVPCDLPPGIPKRDLVLAILFSSSSSVSVIVKPGARYLHVSAVCQLQQLNLTHTPRQAINQSIN